MLQTAQTLQGDRQGETDNQFKPSTACERNLSLQLLWLLVHPALPEFHEKIITMELMAAMKITPGKV